MITANRISPNPAATTINTVELLVPFSLLVFLSLLLILVITPAMHKNTASISRDYSLYISVLAVANDLGSSHNKFSFLLATFVGQKLKLIKMLLYNTIM